MLPSTTSQVAIRTADTCASEPSPKCKTLMTRVRRRSPCCNRWKNWTASALADGRGHTALRGSTKCLGNQSACQRGLMLGKRHDDCEDGVNCVDFHDDDDQPMMADAP